MVHIGRCALPGFARDPGWPGSQPGASLPSMALFADRHLSVTSVVDQLSRAVMMHSPG